MHTAGIRLAETQTATTSGQALGKGCKELGSILTLTTKKLEQLRVSPREYSTFIAHYPHVSFTFTFTTLAMLPG
jgi:hypothetical protein